MHICSPLKFETGERKNVQVFPQRLGLQPGLVGVTQQGLKPHPDLRERTVVWRTYGSGHLQKPVFSYAVTAPLPASSAQLCSGGLEEGPRLSKETKLLTLG